MTATLFDAAPGPRNESRKDAAREPKSPAPHVCAWCGSDLAPFGKGSPFRFDQIVWACSQHRERLG